MLHARFPRLERDEAVREAKELEATLGVRVKVLRETYNTDSNAFDETEVYLSGRGVQAKKAPGATGGGRAMAASRPAAGRTAAGGGDRKGAQPVRRGAVAPPAAGAGTVLWRLSFILLVAIALALAALRLVPTVIEFLYDYGYRVTPEGYGQLLFTVFCLVFLVSAVPLALRFLPRHANLSLNRPGFAWNAAPSRKQKSDAEVKKSLDKLARQAEAQIPDKWSDDEPEPEPEPEPPPPPEDEDFLPEILPSPEDDLPEINPPSDDAAVEAGPEAGAVAAALDALPATPAFEASKGVVDRFFDNAIDTVRRITPVLDKYNKFALNLYMAGAIETIAQMKSLDPPGRRKLLKEVLEKLGASPEMAAGFGDKLPEYMLEPRYMRMIQVGRGAMDSWADGDEMSPGIALQTAVKDWNKPAGEKKPSIMTVMFTDMVGSTDLTQARGDLAAQEIVRKHNAIVRTALTQFAGREVKHTGDGIMASFASAANAADATIHIQRQVATHNEKLPNLPLHLRIGLNSGEPIQEEDDLFGSTVQLAARVCAATQSDQTLCTQVVKDLTGAKAIRFEDGGMHSLKGFRDKFQLWEVVWR